MKLKLPTFILVLIALPVLAIGCGGGGDNDSAAPNGDVEAATAAAQATATALREQNPKAVCSSLSPTFLKEQMKSVARCVKAFRQLLKHAGENTIAVEVGEVTLEGDRGEAKLLKADGSQQGTVYLVREDGQWYSTLQSPPSPGGPTGEDAEAENTDG